MAEEGKNPNQPQGESETASSNLEKPEETLKPELSDRGVLEDLGSLEVEDMPESNELQERRRKTKNRLQELANMDPEAPVQEDKAFEEEEAGLMDLLREANLSPRHLKFCCGGILAVALLVGLFFGGKSLWNSWQNRPQDEDPTEEPVDEPDTDGNEIDEDASFLDPSILSGILVGEDQSEDDETTETGEDLGEESGADVLSQHIEDFAKVFESIQVDVNELLNKSSDRTSALDDYLNELNYHIYLSNQNIESLQEESEDLAEKFTALEDAKADQEARFFEELQDLNSSAAVAALNAFVEEGEDIVRLRAEFNARQKLLSYFAQALVVLERREKDIDLNREALLKGVQVVEVEGSDLNLIIDEDEL